MEAISIIIPVFNQVKYTENCLLTLRQDSELRQKVEVVVVDNGSTDETPQVLASLREGWAGLHVHQLKENSGFSRACNTGAQLATCPYLLFLNNDTLPQPGWLSHLWQTLQLPGAGIVGPKLLYPEDLTINHCGYVYNRGRRSFYPIYHRYPGDFPGANRRRVFQALLGACVMLRRDLFLNVGGFSDFGLEDVDLCLKIGRKGFRVIYEPESTVLHHGSVTLQNSLPGSIPETDCLGFNRAWPPETLIADDERYYSEDGLRLVEINEKNVITLHEIVTEALRLYANAQKLNETGDTAGAVGLLERAVSLYRGFEGGYQELIAIHLERNEEEKALRLADEMVSHVASIHKAYLIAAQIAAGSGRKEKAILYTEYLMKDWKTPEQLRAQAGELRSAVSVVRH